MSNKEQLDQSHNKSLQDLKISIMQLKNSLAFEELKYENLLLKLQIAYKLNDGDQIADDGTIVRKVSEDDKDQKDIGTVEEVG